MPLPVVAKKLIILAGLAIASHVIDKIGKDVQKKVEEINK